MLLNFGVQMGTSAFSMVWPLTRYRKENTRSNAPPIAWKTFHFEGLLLENSDKGVTPTMSFSAFGINIRSLYGLDHVGDRFSPSIQVPDKWAFQPQASVNQKFQLTFLNTTNN
jgi:hypothetical protein